MEFASKCIQFPLIHIIEELKETECAFKPSAFGVHQTCSVPLAS